MKPQRWIIVGSTAALGLLVWAAVSPGPDDSSLRLWAALISLAAVGVLGGSLAGESAAAAAFATVSGPAAVAPWTFPLGDGDGLWLTIYALFLAVALIARVVGASVQHTWPIAARPGRSGKIASSIALLCIAGLLSASGYVLLERRPDPYPKLAAIVDGVQRPDDFEFKQREDLGNRLCKRGCSPSVRKSYLWEDGARRACATVSDVIGAGFDRTEPIANFATGRDESCAWTGSIAGKTVVVGVELDRANAWLVITAHA